MQSHAGESHTPGPAVTKHLNGLSWAQDSGFLNRLFVIIRRKARPIRSNALFRSMHTEFITVAISQAWNVINVHSTQVTFA